jgi:uncharacterized protein (UPF0335 family)
MPFIISDSFRKYSYTKSYISVDEFYVSVYKDSGYNLTILNCYIILRKRKKEERKEEVALRRI